MLLNGLIFVDMNNKFTKNRLLNKLIDMKQFSKKINFSTLLLFFSFLLYSQEQGAIRLGVNLDLAIPNAGFGTGGNLDLRYNILDKLNAGLKIGSLYGVHDVVKNQSELTGTLTASIINSYLITSDYYFNNTESILAPFVGGGFGLFNVSNLKLALTEKPTYSNLVNFDRDTKIGGLIRCGIEISKIRLGLEYFLIPQSNLYNITNANVEVTKNSYFNISLGFYLGGGKWNNKY